jgi:uncharacterized protein
MLRRAFPTLFAMSPRMLARSVLRAGVIAWIAIFAVVYPFQRKLLFVPMGGHVTPESVGLKGFREEAVTTPDGERLITWVSPAKPGLPTILYLHGNAGNLSWQAGRHQQFQAAGYGVRVLSYRGFGGSTGSPSEAGLMTDARATYDTMRSEGLEARNIVLFGESLGTGVAVQLAVSRPVAGVILDSPYTSTVDVAARQYPYLPVTYLMWDRFNSRALIAQIGAPLLIVHGDNDTVVPYDLGVALFADAVEPKQFVSLVGETHVVPLQRGGWAAIVPFMDRVMRRETAGARAALGTVSTLRR